MPALQAKCKLCLNCAVTIMAKIKSLIQITELFTAHTPHSSLWDTRILSNEEYDLFHMHHSQEY